jgi:hypothetical protein
LQIGLAHAPAHDLQTELHNAQPGCAHAIQAPPRNCSDALSVIPCRADDGEIEAALREIHLVPIDDLKLDTALLAGGENEIAAPLFKRRHHARPQAARRDTSGR